MLARRALLSLALMSLALTAAIPVHAVERSEVPVQYTWDLRTLYPTDAAWLAAKKNIEGRIPALEKFKGTLGKSPASLADALTSIMAVNKDLDRLYTYASQTSDQDARISKYIEMRESAASSG